MMMPVPRSDSLALSACRLFESDDLEETRDRISRVMQPHTLTPTGRRHPHRSHMDFLQMPGIGIGHDRLRREDDRGGPRSTAITLLVFCIRGQALLRSGTNEMVATAHQGVMTHDSQSLHGKFSADCEQFVVRIDKKRLAAYSGQRNPVLNQVVDLKRASLRPWVTALRNLATDARAVQLVRDDPRLATTYGNLLVSFSSMAKACWDTAPEPKGASPRSVHRALAFIESHVTEPIHLEDIAKAADVPTPHALRGLPPFSRRQPDAPPAQPAGWTVCASTFWRAAGEGNVTTIALDAGFGHLGALRPGLCGPFRRKTV